MIDQKASEPLKLLPRSRTGTCSDLGVSERGDVPADRLVVLNQRCLSRPRSAAADSADGWGICDFPLPRRLGTT